MIIDRSKFFAQWSAGIFGGTILAIAGFLSMNSYGANYGCFPFIDAIFGTAGYESCGSFGGITGNIIGAISGIAIVSKIKISNYSEIAMYLLFGSFFLPLSFGLMMVWPLEDSDFFIVPVFILIDIFASAIASLLIIAAIRIYSRHKFIMKKIL